MTQSKKKSEATFQGFYKTDAFVLTKEMHSFGDFISTVVKFSAHRLISIVYWQLPRYVASIAEVLLHNRLDNLKPLELLALLVNRESLPPL